MLLAVNWQRSTLQQGSTYNEDIQVRETVEQST